MALKPQTVETPMLDGVVVMKWVLANGDDGAPWMSADFSDKTVQVTGTFGASGKVIIEGSNKPLASEDADFATLNDPQGNVLEITAAKVEAILENPMYIRPHVTVGDGTTALTVRVVGRNVGRGRG